MDSCFISYQYIKHPTDILTSKVSLAKSYYESYENQDVVVVLLGVIVSYDGQRNYSDLT